jgi:hypothetical protein
LPVLGVISVRMRCALTGRSCPEDYSSDASVRLPVTAAP